ncbi:MAG: serine/threonine-protein kinase, partial [Anaerolineae bacterium]
GSQTYRFTNVASPTQRQQTKWALYGAAIGAIGFVFIRLATTILLPVIASGYDPASPAASLIEYIIYVAIGLPIPITLAISIFRFRLWDVDFLINRSLVYGALTVLLVVLFGGVLLGLTRLLSTMSSAQQSLLAVAIAAAVFGVLFAPTRRALQRLVDRRLYGIEIDYQQPAEPLRDQKVVLPPRDPTSLGDYGRLEMIGSGGMADVYRGRHPSLDSDVAIKALSVKHLTSDDTRRRFQREAQVIAGLKHPNIVHVYDYGESDHTLYMVMEYIAGPTLSRMLDEKERFTLEEALPLLRDVAGALDYAHQQHLVHRDVKPSNVMVELPQTPGRAEARAVLMDFGIARVMDRTSQLTTTGVVGTFSYMAPEQIQAAKDIDGRADVYALGIVAYEMLTGELPFKSNNPGAVLIAHLQQPPPNAANVNATIPRGVGYAIIRAMAKKPADRFPTAGEFVTALEQAALKFSAA